MDALRALLLALLFAGGGAAALETSVIPLRPGEAMPPPDQRGLDEIESVPVDEIPCPVCSFVVRVPEPERLLRRHGLPSDRLIGWQMQFQSRDADLCPHPASGKVAFQADVAVCPSCGFAGTREEFTDTYGREIREWVVENLAPSMRDAEHRLLGRRSGQLTERETIEFFNHQEDIPDTVRLEHARAIYAVGGENRLKQAEATWRTAWAARRSVSAVPVTPLLAKRTEAVKTAMGKNRRGPPGAKGNLETLDFLLGKNRAGKDRLPASDRLAAKLLRAGELNRLGRSIEAEKQLAEALEDARERSHRPEQDVLWQATNARTARNHRVDELEKARLDAEVEILTRLDLLRSERESLLRAAELIREAVSRGELDGQRDNAVFYTYLTAEFLRRANDFPVASEWFKTALILADQNSDISRAAETQFALTREQAGDTAELLAGSGRDAAVFAKLREICKTP